MLNRIFLYSFQLTVLLLVFCIVSQGQEKNGINVDSILNKNFNENDPYNGVILIAEKGKTIFQQAYGYRDIETGVKLKVDDVFELASVSKQFTAMIIMLLRQEGKLNYDDTVEKYLSIPYKGITIRNLLNHTSGLPDYQEIMDSHWDKSKAAGNNDILEYINKYAPPVLFVPGAKYEYSNTGYVLLASIAEKASGEDFSMMLRKRIFSKLNMKHTDIRTFQKKRNCPILLMVTCWLKVLLNIKKQIRFHRQTIPYGLVTGKVQAESVQLHKIF